MGYHDKHHELNSFFDFDTKNYQVWAMCDQCPYTHKLDIGELSVKKGMKKFADIPGKFTCKNCDGKFVTLRIWKKNSYLISSQFHAEREIERREKRNSGEGWKFNRGE